VTTIPTQVQDNLAQNLPGNDTTLSFSTDLKKAVKTTSENKLYEIGTKTNTIKPSNVIVTGYIRNARSGEPVINASVFVDKLNRGTTTDAYGYFSFTLPAGPHTFNVQGIGIKDAKYQVIIYG
jgi:hypothetical protein